MSLEGVIAKARLMGIPYEADDNFAMVINVNDKSACLYDSTGKKERIVYGYVRHIASGTGFIGIITKNKKYELQLIQTSTGFNMLNINLSDSIVKTGDNHSILFCNENGVETSRGINTILYCAGNIYIISKEERIMIQRPVTSYYSECFDLVKRLNREYLRWGINDIIFSTDGKRVICNSLLNRKNFEDSNGYGELYLLNQDSSLFCATGTANGDRGNLWVLCRYDSKLDHITVSYPAIYQYKITTYSSNMLIDEISYSEGEYLCGDLLMRSIECEGKTRLFPAGRYKGNHESRSRANKAVYAGAGIFLLDAIEMSQDIHDGCENHVALMYNCIIDKVVQMSYFEASKCVRIYSDKSYNIIVDTLTVSEDVRNYLDDEYIEHFEIQLFGDRYRETMLADENIKKKYNTPYKVDWHNLKHTECIMRHLDGMWRFYDKTGKNELDLWQEYR